MKKIGMILSLLLFYASNSYSADLNIDPSALYLKVYKFAVSTSVNCTNLTTVITEDNPTFTNMLDLPNFGSGSIPNGTYPCVAIDFSDNISFVPDATSDSGNCLSGTTYYLDVCSAASALPVEMSDGTSTTCDDTEQRVTMWLSTASSSLSGGSSNAFIKPVGASDGDRGLKLLNALVVSGATSGKFIVNATDKICDGDNITCNGNPSSCEMAPPAFSFSEN